MKEVVFVTGNPDKAAYMTRVVGYPFDHFDGNRLELLRRELHGVIADHPSGTNGYGWDAIFCPDGYDGKTRAELNPSGDATAYPTVKPFAELRTLLTDIQ